MFSSQVMEALSSNSQSKAVLFMKKGKRSVPSLLSEMGEISVNWETVPKTGPPVNTFFPLWQEKA